MTPIQATLCVAMMVFSISPSLAATQPTEKEKLRQQAEHVCYDDAQRLCADVVADEAKVQACMKEKQAQLSPACGKVMSRGLKL